MSGDNERFRESLRERLAAERLFGLEEVYVRSGRFARPAGGRDSGDGAGGEKGMSSEERRDSGDSEVPNETRRRKAVDAARRRALASGAPADRADGAPAPPAGKAEGPAAEPRGQGFEIEELPGAAEAELSLLSEAERAGIPRVSAEGGSKEERLARLAEAVGGCTRCGLARTRTNVVFGEGDAEARLVFVGEAPGADEDATGRPFVGRAGRLLTKIIQAMDYRREDVFICNVLKCRPPGNRAPALDEVAACSPFLHEQIAVIKPKVICALGGPATKTLLNTKEGITRLRGRLFRIKGVPLMPTFHPAYLLRNMREKGKVWEDMKRLRDFLASLEE